MKLQQHFGAIVAALVLIGTLETSAQAQVRFFYYSPQGPFVRSAPFGPVVPYTYTYSYSYNPYVAPYPAYGILPSPILVGAWQYGGSPVYNQRTTEDYGNPRMRASLYPAVPFENAPVERQADVRRVRFEITVPRDDAIVLIDGVATKQTGLARVYTTPPMEEDRLFTSNIEVRWTDEAGKTQSIQRNFEFVAGETIRHTFK
jgi:uncharacterized protein (TIGR03000 family)